MESLFGEWKDGRPACDNWTLPHARLWQNLLERIQRVTSDWIVKQAALDDWCQMVDETCAIFVKDLPVPEADAPDTPRSISEVWKQPWEQPQMTRVDTQGIAWLGMCAAAQTPTPMDGEEPVQTWPLHGSKWSPGHSHRDWGFRGACTRSSQEDLPTERRCVWVVSGCSTDVAAISWMA